MAPKNRNLIRACMNVFVETETNEEKIIYKDIFGKKIL